LPKKATLNDLEIHAGWIENLKNEEKTMKQ